MHCWVIPKQMRFHNRHASESEAQLGAIGAERRQHGPAGVLQGAHCPGQADMVLAESRDQAETKYLSLV